MSDRATEILEESGWWRPLSTREIETQLCLRERRLRKMSLYCGGVHPNVLARAHRDHYCMCLAIVQEWHPRDPREVIGLAVRMNNTSILHELGDPTAIDPQETDDEG